MARAAASRRELEEEEREEREEEEVEEEDPGTEGGVEAASRELRCAPMRRPMRAEGGTHGRTRAWPIG